MSTNKELNINQVSTFIKPIKWCHYIVNAGYATAGVNILAHIIWYFVAGSLLSMPADIYLRYYIVFPAIGMLAFTALVDYFVRSHHISLLAKEYMVLSLLVLFPSYLCLTHRIATVLFGSFVLSVFASAVFSNIKITRCIFILSSFALLLSGIKLFISENHDSKIIMAIFVAWNMLLCSYLISRILIRYGRNNLSSIINLYHQQENMQEQLKLDPFTGLYNRKTFDTRLSEVMEECLRSDICVTLAIIDVDEFKRVNDSYGHPTGDRVLLHLAHILKSNRTESICPFRIGGEEFAIIFKDYCVDEAYKICESMRSIMELSSLHEIDRGSVTFSCGLACMNSLYTNPETLRQAADDALYIAKNNGRNKVVIYDGAKQCINNKHEMCTTYK